MDRETPRFTVFYRFFWPRNPFRMNTSRNFSQVLILNDLLESLSPLESALTKKGGGGVTRLEQRQSYDPPMGSRYSLPPIYYSLFLMNVEIQARNRSRDHIFLNLNEVVIGVSHPEHRKHVGPSRNHHQRSGPIVPVRHPAVVILDSRQSADHRFPLKFSGSSRRFRLTVFRW